MISVTLTGNIIKRNISLRNGAKPNDYIIISGQLGYGRAGLRLFQQNIMGFEKVKKKYLEPKAQLKKAIKYAPYVNSMIDISDGLAPEIKHICDKSKCGAIIYKEKIPINDDVMRAARALQEDEYNYALYGGEDFELLYTVSKNNIDKIDGFIIGEIKKEREIKLKFLDKEIKIDKMGYDHFLNAI
jgi:thiamine-monophosphate kinase